MSMKILREKTDSGAGSTSELLPIGRQFVHLDIQSVTWNKVIMKESMEFGNAYGINQACLKIFLHLHNAMFH